MNKNIVLLDFKSNNIYSTGFLGGARTVGAGVEEGSMCKGVRSGNSNHSLYATETIPINRQSSADLTV